MERPNYDFSLSPNRISFESRFLVYRDIARRQNITCLVMRWDYYCATILSHFSSQNVYSIVRTKIT